MSLVAARLRVAAVTRPSPSYVRLRLEGSDLALLHDGGPRGLRDTRIKLIIGAEQSLPSGALGAGWYPAWRALPVASRGVMRTYTISGLHRRGDASGALCAVDVDILMTDHAGVGVDWARGRPVGQELVLLGPGLDREPGGGADSDPIGMEYRPGAAADVVLVGDSTALPAVGAILAAERGGERRLRAVLSVPRDADRRDMDSPVLWRPDGALVDAAVDVCATTWLTWSRARDRRVRDDLPEVDIDSEILWETPEGGPRAGAPSAPGRRGERASGAEAPPYFWVAGEAGEVVAIRRALVRDLGVPREQVAFMGYWRRGRAESE